MITSTKATRHTGNYSYYYDHYCTIPLIPSAFILTILILTTIPTNQALCPIIHATYYQSSSYLCGFHCNFSFVYQFFMVCRILSHCIIYSIEY